MRAFAHLFGYFSVRRQRLLIELSSYGNRFRCTEVEGFAGGSRGEHQFYWTATKRLLPFVDDALFSNNREQVAKSDVAHRGVASYADHLNRFTPFASVDKDWMQRVLIRLAHTALASEGGVELPDRSDFPQLDTVLTIAYLRIYRFREHLDFILGRPGHFWERQRTPAWCTDLFPFPPRQSRRVLIDD
jgi:hypothetical protein